MCVYKGERGREGGREEEGERGRREKALICMYHCKWLQHHVDGYRMLNRLDWDLDSRWCEFHSHYSSVHSDKWGLFQFQTYPQLWLQALLWDLCSRPAYRWLEHQDHPSRHPGRECPRHLQCIAPPCLQRDYFHQLVWYHHWHRMRLDLYEFCCVCIQELSIVTIISANCH